MEKIILTILIDDINGAEPNFHRSYGFSVLIQMNNKNILFDAGTKVEPLMQNLKVLNLSPLDLDAVILSHNHFDHTNGLVAILKENNQIPIYVHKNWYNPVEYKGFQAPDKNYVINKTAKELTEITEGIFLTNCHTSGDYGGIDEQACYIKAKSSYILLCGCCHPGLNKFLGDRNSIGISSTHKLHLFGGFHGFKFDDVRAKELNPIIESVIICHCTMNGKIFIGQFPKKCKIGKVGEPITFN